MAVATEGVIRHPGDPMWAWSHSVGGRLVSMPPLAHPGSGSSISPVIPSMLFWAIGAALLAVAVLGVWLGPRALRGRTGVGSRLGGRPQPWGRSRLEFLGAGRLGVGRAAQSTPVVSEWASRADLKVLAVPGPRPGRVILGRAGRALLAAEERQSVIVIGPTQTQKTTGFAIPALLEWEGPVLAASVKTDLVASSLNWRSRLGRVWVYDPTATTGLDAADWSPLASCSDWSGARRMAAGLCSTVRQQGGGVADGDFWYATAAKLLAPILFAAAYAGADMADVVRWVDLQEVYEVDNILIQAAVPEALQAARANWQREDRQRSSVYTTAEMVLEAFADPTVAASTRGCDIDVDVFLDGGRHTLYVCSPASEQQRLCPIFSALITQVVNQACAVVARTGHPLDPPLLIVLDEAANIAPLAELDTLASTAAGHGIQLVTVWQDMAQISARYGARSATVVNNHRAKVVLSGITDPATLDHVSLLIGDEEVMRTSRTIGEDGRRSATEGQQTRRLAPGAALRRILPGHGVLVYGHLPPARLSLRPWFREKSLCRRAQGCSGG
ncbi:MAG: type IV secretory system conjugative DNA transfer family protein [Acidimicrobiales bacterium]